MNAAVEAALRDSAPLCEARGLLLVAHLDASADVAHADAVRQAVYTAVRGLLERVAPGTTLRVASHDERGFVSFVWEAREPATAEAGPAEPVAGGPYGDLLEVALMGLERVCEAKLGHRTLREDVPGGLSGLRRSPRVWRRCEFLIPAES